MGHVDLSSCLPMQYADGNHKIWDAFLDEIEPYASRVPYQVAIGNHEYDWNTGLEKKHRSKQIDASGYKEPYEPDWGNFGEGSASAMLSLKLCCADLRKGLNWRLARRRAESSTSSFEV